MADQNAPPLGGEADPNGYNYDDVLWMLLPPPGNMHWLTPETAKEHHIYWAELSPTREQSPLYDYLPPAPSPPVVATPRSRPVAQYTWIIWTIRRSFPSNSAMLARRSSRRCAWRCCDFYQQSNRRTTTTLVLPLSWSTPAAGARVGTYAFPRHQMSPDAQSVVFQPELYSGTVKSTGEFRDRTMVSFPFIEVDCRIHGAASGGPIALQAGRVVAVNCTEMTSTDAPGPGYGAQIRCLNDAFIDDAALPLGKLGSVASPLAS